jgi:hypothetical protein
VSDRLPDGDWLLAVMSDSPGEVPGRRFTVVRTRAIGRSVTARAALPRWAGDVHPVVQTPRGLDPKDAPMQQAWESERMPPGGWVLGVVSDSGRDRTFAVSGPVRTDDPRAAVRDLLAEVEQGRLRQSREPALRSLNDRTGERTNDAALQRSGTRDADQRRPSDSGRIRG